MTQSPGENAETSREDTSPGQADTAPGQEDTAPSREPALPGRPERQPATITPYEDGPLLVRGDFQLLTSDGEIIEPGRATVALCRCGRSGSKPFCDGTHKVINFRAGSGRDA